MHEPLIQTGTGTTHALRNRFRTLCGQKITSYKSVVRPDVPNGIPTCRSCMSVLIRHEWGKLCWINEFSFIDELQERLKETHDDIDKILTQLFHDRLEELYLVHVVGVKSTKAQIIQP